MNSSNAHTVECPVDGELTVRDRCPRCGRRLKGPLTPFTPGDAELIRMASTLYSHFKTPMLRIAEKIEERTSPTAPMTAKETE